jgi:hypothetical protein
MAPSIDSSGILGPFQVHKAVWKIQHSQHQHLTVLLPVHALLQRVPAEA